MVVCKGRQWQDAAGGGQLAVAGWYVGVEVVSRFSLPVCWRVGSFTTCVLIQ